VYRACQEIINNINKHSKASQVNIFFDSKPSKLHIGFVDNGKGIQPSDFEKENHYGLRNLKTRLQEVNVEFLVKANESGRTLTQISVN